MRALISLLAACAALAMSHATVAADGADKSASEGDEIGVYSPSRFAEMAMAANRVFSGRSTRMTDALNAAELKGYVAGIVERMSHDVAADVPLEKCLRVFGHRQLTARVAMYLALPNPVHISDSYPRAKFMAVGQTRLAIYFVCRDIAPD